MIRCLSIIVIFAVHLGTSLIYGQPKTTFPVEISQAAKNADSKLLAKYFNEKIELILPGKSGIYSKAQAEQVMKSFFDQNPVKDFTVIHQGVKDNSSFAIGKYVSSTMSYRFYFRIKESGGMTYIHQIWIENQDE